MMKLSVFFNKTFGVCSVALVAALMSGCGSKAGDGDEAEVVRPIKLFTVGGSHDMRIRRYPATIDSNDSNDLSFSVGGLIVEKPFKESDRVKKGDVIARLEDRDYRNQFQSAESQFANAEEEYQRAVRLDESDAIAKSILEQRATQLEVAKAQLDSAEKALLDTVLRSPIDGVLTKVPGSLLQNITPGTPVATVVSTDEFKATINLPASVVANIEDRADRKVFIALNAAPDVKIEAEFKEATLEADLASQTFGVSFMFERPENLLILPGMNGTVELLSTSVDEAKGRLSVPLEGVLSDGNDTYVWVVDTESMRVSKRAVELEDSVGEMVVVVSGLEEGEVIAAVGASYLSEGLKVRVWTGE